MNIMYILHLERKKSYKIERRIYRINLVQKEKTQGKYVWDITIYILVPHTLYIYIHNNIFFIYNTRIYDEGYYYRI